MTQRAAIAVVALLGISCSSEPADVATSAETRALTTALIHTTRFDAKLHQTGGYDKPIVFIEGYDPMDNYKVDSPDMYWSSYTSPLDGRTYPPRLGGLAARAEQEGFDIWVVSVKFNSGTYPAASTDYAWAIGDAYVAELHDQILNWSGTPQKYILGGASAGGLVARKALATLGSRRGGEIAAYVSYDAPHEGAYVPMALQMYMADYKICDSDPLQPDVVGCWTRFVINGLATQSVYSVLKYRLYPTCTPYPYSSWNYWPSFWNDCHDLGGCTLPDDGFGEMNHCGDNDGGIIHGSFATETRDAAWFNSNYGGWFTDIPRYAISNSSIHDLTYTTYASRYEISYTNVSNAGDHHLYSDVPSQAQVRGSLDPFMDRLAGVYGSGFFSWRINGERYFNFVSFDSAFGVNQGLSWTGRLLGQNLKSGQTLPQISSNVPQPGFALHENVTQDTVDYLAQIANATFAGSTVAGDKLPGSYVACGDGVCAGSENQDTCGADCGVDLAVCGGTSGQWAGCRGNGCAVCTEKLVGYPYYLKNHPACAPNGTCAGGFYTCNSKCPAPTAADTGCGDGICAAPETQDNCAVDCGTNAPACSGTSGQWAGCRGNGCAVCSEKLIGFPNYIRNHPACAPNGTCAGSVYTCNSKCPAPTSADR